MAVARRKLQRGEDVVEVAEEADAAAEEEQGGAKVVDLMALLKQRMGEGAAPARRSSVGPRAKSRKSRRAT